MRGMLSRTTSASVERWVLLSRVVRRVAINVPTELRHRITAHSWHVLLIILLVPIIVFLSL